MLKNLRENRKKGFTLVELIVVLVILAILAALLIPALTGYIDKAKEKQIIAETRQTVMAAQTLVDEEYGKQKLGDESVINVDKKAVALLAEVPEGNITTIYVGNGKNSDDVTNNLIGKVKKVVYERDGKSCTYTKTDATSAGTYEIK